jgi:DNA-directed RNA polymerase subunit RPC12/RpoP
MYCPRCGKEIANDSNFCKYCGNKVSTSVLDTMPERFEYEYYVFESSSDDGRCFDDVKAYGAAELNRDGLREAEARLHFWQKWQTELLPTFQELIDKGWQPATEISPGCLKVRHSSQRKRSIPENMLPIGYWELIGAYVKFRRPKTSVSTNNQTTQS